MEYTLHNSEIAMRGLEQLSFSCIGRRVWSLNFQ